VRNKQGQNEENGVVIVSENVQLQFQLDFMDTDSYIYKSNSLIESAYNLSINEQRLLHMAIKKLKPQYIRSNLKPSELDTLKVQLSDTRFDEVKIYVNEFKNEFNINGNYLYERLAEITSSLYKKDLQYFNDIDNYTTKRWTTECEYDKNSRYVKITFNPNLILDLLIFKSDYSKLQYSVIKHLNTTYSFRIYELMKSYVYKGTRTISLTDLRYKLEIDNGSYSTFSDLKKRVIKPSVDAINKHTDITLDFETIRKGRKIDEIKFIIALKENTEIALDKYDKEDNDLADVVSQIVKIKLMPKQASVIADETIKAIKVLDLDMSAKEYITEKIDIINEYNKSNEVPNYVGAVIKAIKENWQPNIIVGKKNKFHSYDQRNYNMDKLEQGLLGWETCDNLDDLYK